MTAIEHVGSSGEAPSISVARRGLRIDDAHLDNYRRATGGKLSEYLPLEYPLAFGRLCGDFNPSHYFSPLARLLGFDRAFCHTQRLVAGCVDRLPPAAKLASLDSVRLDVAFKGPVYYGDRLKMKTAAAGRGYRFDVYAGSGNKPVMPGRIAAAV